LGLTKEERATRTVAGDAPSKDTSYGTNIFDVEGLENAVLEEVTKELRRPTRNRSSK